MTVPANRTIYIFTGSGVPNTCAITNEIFETIAEGQRQGQIQTTGHELGHVFRLDHGNSACLVPPEGDKVSIMMPATGDRKAVNEDSCEALQKEIDRRVCEDNPDDDRCDGGGGEDPECLASDPNCGDPIPDDDDCEGNPGPNCPVDCDTNPFHPDCAVPCWVNPDTSLPAAMGYTTDLLPFSLTKTVTSNNPGGLHHDFKLTASADVTVSLTGMTANFDCTVGTDNCSNNTGNADDTWSGTLAAGGHRIAVSISALATSGGTYTLSAAVTRQTQSLSWTVPTSSVPITGYQLQVRNSSTSRWRCTSAGSGASCSLSGSTTSWSVTTSAGLTRHYRVRASNAGGSGGWSNEVVLTSGGG